MASVNRIHVVGNLGKDPELRYTQGGQATCELSVATSERWNDKNGAPQEHTEWHRVVLWGKTAENAAKYLAKGRSVYVEGRVRTRKWEDKQGQQRFTTEIIAESVQFLGGPQERTNDAAPSPQRPVGADPNDTDVPF